MCAQTRGTPALHSSFAAPDRRATAALHLARSTAASNTSASLSGCGRAERKGPTAAAARTDRIYSSMVVAVHKRRVSSRGWLLRKHTEQQRPAAKAEPQKSKELSVHVRKPTKTSLTGFRGFLVKGVQFRVSIFKSFPLNTNEWVHAFHAELAVRQSRKCLRSQTCCDPSTSEGRKPFLLRSVRLFINKSQRKQ